MTNSPLPWSATLGASSVSLDRLSGLLERFRVRAQLFHAGPLCGVSHFEAKPGRAFLHVLRRGQLDLRHPARAGLPRQQRLLCITEPTLLLYARPVAHAFHNPPVDGSDFVCATLDFDGGTNNPLVRALPPLVVLPLVEVEGLQHTLHLLFAETEKQRCGHRLLADRLFEVLLVQVLRWLLDHPEHASVSEGMLCGLAHPKLARALTAMHERPGDPWALDSLAAQAGMSRSAFAQAFKARTGVGPAQYLLHWRVALAQSRLAQGTAVKTVADELGYADAASFSRAFSQAVGQSPRQWAQGRAELR